MQCKGGFAETDKWSLTRSFEYRGDLPFPGRGFTNAKTLASTASDTLIGEVGMYGLVNNGIRTLIIDAHGARFALRPVSTTKSSRTSQHMMTNTPTRWLRR